MMRLMKFVEDMSKKLAEEWAEEYLAQHILPESNENFLQFVRYGRCAYRVSKDGHFENLTEEELFNILDSDCVVSTESLSSAEIAERYKDLLTHKQLKELKKLKKKLKAKYD